jgi:hypothetical protein
MIEYSTTRVLAEPEVQAFRRISRSGGAPDVEERVYLDMNGEHVRGRGRLAEIFGALSLLA